MKGNRTSVGIPRLLGRRLQAIRRQSIRGEFLTWLLLASAGLLMAAVLAMLIDWIVVLFDPGIRRALTGAAVGVGVALLGWGCWRVFWRRQTLAGVAREVDRAFPNLQERCSTVTELAQSEDPPEIRGSEALIQKVSEEAEVLGREVEPERVLSTANLRRSRNFFFAGAGLLVLLFLLDFDRANVLLQRFLAPSEAISLTQVRAVSGDMTVAHGEAAFLAAVAEGRLANSAHLMIRDEGGETAIVRLRPERKSDQAGTIGFSYARESVKEPFEYAIRSGDGQTPWYRVRVAERPRLTGIAFYLVPPAYSRLPELELPSLPAHLRVLEGSALAVAFTADQPSAHLRLRLADGSRIKLDPIGDGHFRFATNLTASLEFRAILENEYHLENQVQPTCSLEVYPDQPPAVTISSPDNQATVRPDEKVGIQFQARDDFGIAQAELIVARNSSTEEPLVVPVELEEKGATEIEREILLDLAELELKHGDELTYTVRVVDTREAGAEAAITTAAARGANQNQGDQARSSDTPSSRTVEANAKADAVDLAASDPSEQNPPPENPMSKRLLDVARQSASCSPRKLVIDQWAGSFDGERREKQEMAIDSVLQKLHQHLETAQEKVDPLIGGTRSSGFPDTAAQSVRQAEAELELADESVTELKITSTGTPYAFIGLQLHNIAQAHISPARENLSQARVDKSPAKAVPALERASFHIRRAREMLADLTRQYDSAKREQKSAEIAQRIQRLHQIFLEESQAFLGSQKPALNSFERKLAEVDEAFVEKLKELLEEKQRLLAELARVLADDPRLLRRYLAQAAVQSSSLRDQLTLLARRQSSLQNLVQAWCEASPDDRARVLQDFILVCATEQIEIASQTAQWHEDLVTWLPLDIEPTAEAVQPMIEHAAAAARLAAASGDPNLVELSADGGELEASQALDHVREVHALLPSLFDALPDSDNLAIYVGKRTAEAATLVTRQSGWIEKRRALRDARFARAAQIDQHRLHLDTLQLTEKLDLAFESLAELSPSISTNCTELQATLREDLLPVQDEATASLEDERLDPANEAQQKACRAFAKAEEQMDELIRQVIEKLDSAPPPSNPGSAPSLDDLLALLEEEQEACETLGIPCRPINVSILKDWVQPGSCSGNGQDQALTMMAQAQSQRAADRASRLEKATHSASADGQEDEDDRTASALRPGPRQPDQSWNVLVSKLGKELQQGRDTTPPEEYRQAIENYFREIAERIPFERDQ